MECSSVCSLEHFVKILYKKNFVNLFLPILKTVKYLRLNIFFLWNLLRKENIPVYSSAQALNKNQD